MNARVCQVIISALAMTILPCVVSMFLPLFSSSALVLLSIYVLVRVMSTRKTRTVINSLHFPK
jgi:flagellar biogenesis protein FliO